MAIKKLSSKNKYTFILDDECFNLLQKAKEEAKKRKLKIEYTSDLNKLLTKLLKADLTEMQLIQNTKEETKEETKPLYNNF